MSNEHEDPYRFACPKCGGEFAVEPGDDLCHADDWADGCTTSCPGCGTALKMETRTEVFFTVTLAPKWAGARWEGGGTS